MSESIRVLYLSYDGLTDPLGQSQILPYVSDLSRRGYEFTIISFEKKGPFSLHQKEIKRLCHQDNIKWVPLPYHRQPPVLSTLYDVWILWQEVKRNYQQHPFKIIHCRSYITSLIGQRAKHKWRVKFIFDMRGFWADERVEGGLWNLKNPIFRLVYNFFKRKEKEFLKEADQVVSLTYNAKEEIESWKIRNAPITVIPTCVDLNLFDPAKINKDDQDLLRKELGIKPGDFVLLYLGSWGTWYLTQEMLFFFSELKKLKPNAKFLIVTGDKLNLEESSHKESILITQSSRTKVPLHISIADVSVCFIKPSFSKKASSATKMGEIMAMNMPIITNEGWGDVKNIFGDRSNGFVLRDFSNQSLEKAIFWMTAIREVGWQQSTHQFDLKIGVDRYASLYQF